MQWGREGVGGNGGTKIEKIEGLRGKNDMEAEGGGGGGGGGGSLLYPQPALCTERCVPRRALL